MPAVYNTATNEFETAPSLEQVIANYEKSGFFRADSPLDHGMRKELLKSSIHRQLGEFYSALTDDFDGILDYVKGVLGSHCGEYFTDVELRRIIGAEIGWRAITQAGNNDLTESEKSALKRRQRGRSWGQWREDFIDEQAFGREPDMVTQMRWPDQSKVVTHGHALINYIKTWADFPAFGFGISELDETTGGLLPGEICVLTGAPGTMKTSLALSAVDDFVSRAESGKVLFVSADMPPREIKLRMIERESGIYNSQLRYLLAQSSPEALQANQQVDDKYNKRLDIIGNEDGIILTLKDVLAECLVRQPQLVIVDYLTRLKSDGQSDLEFVEKGMKSILAHAHRYETSFILLSQMSRASRSDQTAGRVGGHSRGGGIVEELADCEIELVKQFSKENLPPEIIACVTKARRGISGKYFALGYDGPTKRFDGTAQEMVKRVERKQTFEPKPKFY